MYTELFQGKMHFHGSYDSPGGQLLIVVSNISDGESGKPERSHPAFGLVSLSATEVKRCRKRQSLQQSRDNADFQYCTGNSAPCKQKKGGKVAKRSEARQRAQQSGGSLHHF